MGRQHTTWISDETWDRLQRIGGDSISEKIRNAVKYADPADFLHRRALDARIEVATNAIKDIDFCLKVDNSAQWMVEAIEEIIEDVYTSIVGVDE